LSATPVKSIDRALERVFGQNGLTPVTLKDTDTNLIERETRQFYISEIAKYLARNQGFGGGAD